MHCGNGSDRFRILVNLNHLFSLNRLLNHSLHKVIQKSGKADFVMVNIDKRKMQDTDIADIARQRCPAKNTISKDPKTVQCVRIKDYAGDRIKYLLRSCGRNLISSFHKLSRSLSRT